MCLRGSVGGAGAELGAAPNVDPIWPAPTGEGGQGSPELKSWAAVTVAPTAILVGWYTVGPGDFRVDPYHTIALRSRRVPRAGYGSVPLAGPTGYARPGGQVSARRAHLKRQQGCQHDPQPGVPGEHDGEQARSKCVRHRPGQIERRDVSATKRVGSGLDDQGVDHAGVDHHGDGIQDRDADRYATMASRGSSGAAPRTRRSPPRAVRSASGRVRRWRSSRRTKLVCATASSAV